MNLRKYYEQVKTIRESIPEEFAYVTSLATANGGKAGVVTQVDRDLAARMIADGVARLSQAEEVKAYEAENEQGRNVAREEQLRNRLRIALVNEPEIEASRQKSETGSKGKH
jgi:hypothetical protein